MIRILDILSGPYEQEGVVWLECLMTDGLGSEWSEDIYYDNIGDALEELEDIHLYGSIDLDDYMLDEDEEGDGYYDKP